MSAPAYRLRPTYSGRLFHAFAEVLADRPDLGRAAQQLSPLSNERVLVEVAHQALSIAVAATGDPDLGLKAARRLVLGDIGTIDYVVGSAPTVRDAVEHSARYLRLINEALEVRLQLEGRLAILRLEENVAIPRAAADFAMGGFFRNHVRRWFDHQLPDVDVWFSHHPPESVAEYELTFAPSKLRFNAPVLGFSFDRDLLDHVLPTADPNLQQVVVPYANLTLERLTTANTVTVEVRAVVEEQMTRGSPDVGEAASRLGMSVRTLARRLEAEGTTFRDVIDDVRRRLALMFVGQTDRAFSEISDKLGFSHGAAFHRAFRRWTALTPLAYRRSHGR